MRSRLISALMCLLFVSSANSAFSATTVTNVVARQRTDGSHKVDITYNAYDSESAYLRVSMLASNDGGATYTVPCSHVSGAVGYRIRPGNGKKIVWDCAADQPGVIGSNFRAKIVAETCSDAGVNPGEMVYVPAGSFLMGNSGVGDDLRYDQQGVCGEEKPQHSVYVRGFWIGKYEVTRAEYRQFIAAGGYSNHAFWPDEGWNWKVTNNRMEPRFWATKVCFYHTLCCGPPCDPSTCPYAFAQTDDHPVAGVTYYEAEAFCNWAGGRLPTEAQWEKAARWTGSHANVYPWSDTWDAEKCNNIYDHNPAGGGYAAYQTAPVGSYASGASPYGCQDMAGNAWEWCSDWVDASYYSHMPEGGWVDPPGPIFGTVRALRGASWYNGNTLDFNPYKYRCAARYAGCPYWDAVLGPHGFRLAR